MDENYIAYEMALDRIRKLSEKEIRNGKAERLLSVARRFPEMGDDYTILEDIESGMDQET